MAKAKVTRDKWHWRARAYLRYAGHKPTDTGFDALVESKAADLRLKRPRAVEGGR